ncbi:MOSC domain-containing protein [Vibrio sp. SS-MA-C1-2]|uniref:MOSC domain-containing protein n=1 Tax=Vibrio sp. SS-MA-C1-2 TaxID=2908646 RepID=UPI001F318771|nr:MOSC domain-containing protein [Vibrio sp. SS-MA-C1-2]UJF16941.1 MOSC domain-containing protein [Vibrio sp. SS-MA-C1-2]
MSQSTAVLSQINIYPIKSTSGISLSSSWVNLTGLSFDRHFMIMLNSGKMATARQFPQLVKLQTNLQPFGLTLNYPTKGHLTIRYQDFSQQLISTQVWNDSFSAYSTLDIADQWVSEVIGQPAQLLYIGEEPNRIGGETKDNLTFADGFPLLVISEGSLQDLNQRSSEVHTMDQFRTNLVVSGVEPFAEDTWKRIKIGDIEFDIVKPCSRCIMTTVDPLTGKKSESQEPMKTLTTYRCNEKGWVIFGQNIIPRNSGIIEQGAEITVIEYQ